MASLLAGDDIISDESPARVLVVDRAENLPAVREALGPYSGFLKVDFCHDLRSALEQAGAEVHDVVLLSLDLPDSWPADTYDRFRQATADLPVLVLAPSEDGGPLARSARRPPFCIIDASEAEPALIRRLIVSACLFQRSGRKPHGSLGLAAEPC